MNNPIGIAIHGGAGALKREDLSAAEWAQARATLRQSLGAAHAILARGGSALDAVEAAVVIMEDALPFSAGYGSALNAGNFHELDASIMDGATLAAGSVCCARRIRNPIRAARAIMAEGEWVSLACDGADAWAERAGLAMVPNSYFTTPRRVEAWRRQKALDEARGREPAGKEGRHSTVGAVALDRSGNLAAATSSGGFDNKPVGRFSDVGVIGAGTYARNGTCAVSFTGRGELVIRSVAGHEIASRMAYGGQSLKEATDRFIFVDVKRWDNDAGLCAIDAQGNAVLPYSTLAMYRGYVTPDGALHVGIHDDFAREETLPLGAP
jgi:beta-aspartyl-peptidase (threonine type)